MYFGRTNISHRYWDEEEKNVLLFVSAHFGCTLILPGCQSPFLNNEKDQEKQDWENVTQS